MLIDCPACAKSYHIVKAVLGSRGRRVACPRCDTIWFVTPEGTTPTREGTDRVDLSGSFDVSSAHVEDAFPGFQMPFANSAPLPLRRKRRRLPSGLKDCLAGAALIALAMAIIGWRVDIVRLLPQSATAYAAIGLPVNLQGLELRNLRSVASNNGRETVLRIEGQIVNLRARETEVPPIHLAIRDASGHELYRWTVSPQKRTLDADEMALFRARLVAPPAGSQEVLASFAPEQDIASR